MRLNQSCVNVETLPVQQPSTITTLIELWKLVLGCRWLLCAVLAWRRGQRAVQNEKMCVYTAMSQDCVSHCGNSMPFVAACKCLSLPELSGLDYLTDKEWMGEETRFQLLLVSTSPKNRPTSDQ